MHPAINALGQEHRGFLVTKYLPLKELNSTLIEMVHEESGARIIHIANDDPENLFALSFQTLPDSSNGVAHVLEHTVLCGSKKFPVKDPFFAMTRRSLNTYMNALTGQDFTVYPASSQVEKDFYNLLEVYIDAVFHPLLKQLSFLQEGHRLSFTVPGDISSPLQYQGIVYNEMKGAMNSSEDRLSSHLFKHLCPDLPYAFNSGGDPEEIPSLTYEQLLEFHQTFYHPSRCLFFFYGNLPLAKHIDFVSEHALKHIQKVSPLSPLPMQKRMSDPLHVEEFYPVSPDEEISRKTIVSLGFLTAPISHQSELLALSLIDSLLTDTDVSPLKLALLKSKLCTTVESLFDTEMSEAPWILICKGCHEHSTDKIVKTVRTCLTELERTGFDPKAIEASLHQLEFERTEIGGDSIPFGLTLFFRAVLAKQHGAAPEQSLLIHSLFEDLRSRIKDPTYLTGLLRRYILDNPHAVYLTLKPDPLFIEKEKDEEKKSLAALQSRLTPEQLQKIDAQEKKLAAFQEEVEHQSIDCLPKINLSDIPIHAKDYPLTSTPFNSLTLFHHSCLTNHILYADLHLDLPQVLFQDFPLLSMFTRFWIELGCGGRSYEQFLEMQQASLGDLSASFSLHVQHDDPAICRPTLSLRAKALERNAAPLFDILRDCASSPNFQDPSRIKELLDEHATELQNRLAKDAMGYAIQLASGSLSIPSAIQEQLQGLPYFSFALDAAKSGVPSLIDRFVKLQHSILGTPHPALVLSCGTEERKHLSPHLSTLAESLPSHPLPLWKTIAPVEAARSQGRIIGSPVAFSALAFATTTYRDSDSPALMVATNLLENVVLHKEIREKGGAYGSGAAYSPATGHFHFYSYRDPHIHRTYAAFLQAIDRIASGQFSERELFEAKLGIIQSLDSPLPPRQRAAAAFGWQRAGRTYSHRDDYRRSILNVSASDICAAMTKHLAAQKSKGVFVSLAGEELLRKEAGRLPFSFEILPIRTSLNN
ncbi:MAG: pitrm1 [Parachlamydiales bacterium]|nr:pitrm1 [Parachlamydiales bacterium]